MDRTNLRDLYQKSDFASAFFFFLVKKLICSLYILGLQRKNGWLRPCKQKNEPLFQLLMCRRYDNVVLTQLFLE